jgi:iron complex transport system substrate-binding protein
VTEIVYALGAGERVIAVDTTSYHPTATHGLPKVGYLRQLSAEGILSVRPDLVVGLEEAGPPQTLVQLRDSGTKLQLLPDRFTADGVTAKIRAVATTLGVAERGEAMAAGVAADLAQIEAALASVRLRPKVLFLLATSRGAPLASGSETAADAMIRLAGGMNAVEGYRGYKPLSVESAVAAAPDLVLMMQQSIDTLGGVEAVLALPAIAATPAGKARRVFAFDGLYLLGFGPRTAQAVSEVARLLHPELALPPLPSRDWAAARP